MTPPEVQPVYLLMPSGGWERAGAPIEAFIDTIAVDPVIAERVLLAVVEYSTFINELYPLGDQLEDAALVTVSNFDGLSYASAFESLVRLMEYDRYRLSDDGVRLGRPLVIAIVHRAPADDDAWLDEHKGIVGREGEAAPVIEVVATDPSARAFADEIAFPSRRCAVATPPVNAGARAAAIVAAAFARGIGVGVESAEGLLNAGLAP